MTPLSQPAPVTDSFYSRLRDKLRDPAFRHMDGFPAATNDAILAHFHTPAATACPNPFFYAFLTHSTPALPVTDTARLPMRRAALTYHTRVPSAIIEDLIKKHSAPNDLVLDCFCGSGSTITAARRTGRRVIGIDLSPAATAIATCYGVPVDRVELQAASDEFLKALQQEGVELYVLENGGTIEYIIWGDVCQCPHCQETFCVAEATPDPKAPFACPHCQTHLHPNKLKRCFDDTGKNVEYPIRLKYQNRKGEVTLSTTEQARLASVPPPAGFLNHPLKLVTSEMAFKRWEMHRAGYHSGMDKVSDFFYPRSLLALKLALEIVERQPMSAAVRHVLRTAVINAAPQFSRMRRAYQSVIPLLLYVPRARREVNVVTALTRKITEVVAELNALPPTANALISTQSSTQVPQLPDNSVDYVFIDPPFGENIIYSELNYIWESLMGVFTAHETEAIVSRAHRKGVDDYQHLMTTCLREIYRVLKPGRWMTLVFHNSDQQVWNALQQALRSAGFNLVDTQPLDKGQASFKQVATENAVKHDLMLLCQKPLVVEALAAPKTGTLEQVWATVRNRLGHLPVLTTPAGKLAQDRERQKYLLFDHVVAQHLRHGLTLPISAGEFYAGLNQHFVEDSDMYFLPEQVAGYTTNQ